MDILSTVHVSPELDLLVVVVVVVVVVFVVVVFVVVVVVTVDVAAVVAAAVGRLQLKFVGLQPLVRST